MLFQVFVRLSSVLIDYSVIIARIGGLWGCYVPEGLLAHRIIGLTWDRLYYTPHRAR
jgi:hypothetical protein